MLGRILRVIIQAILLNLLLVSVVSALSIGDVKVYSYLNEPLSAEIPISDLDGEDLGRMQVRLASDKDFKRAGIELKYILRNMLFEIVVYKDQPYIYIRTAKVITEPYIKLLVEIETPDGKFIKDYTLLIDPPPPNTTKANHPIAFSQMAINDAQNKPFGGDEVEQQLSAQENKERQQKVAETRQKFKGNVFSDETIDGIAANQTPPAGTTAPAPAPANNQAAESELIPGVVPDVTETTPTSSSAAPVAPPAATVPVAPASPASAKADVAVKPPVAVVPLETHTQKSATQPSAGANKVNAPSAPVIEQKANNSGNPQVTTISPESNLPEQVVEPEDIDFNEVIKPSTASESTKQPAAVTVKQNEVSASSVTPPEESSGGNYIYLGFILSLLLLAVGVAVSVKRGYHKKILDAYEHFQVQRAHKNESEQIDEEESLGIIVNDEDDFEADAAEKLINDEFNEQNADEEIELSSNPISDAETTASKTNPATPVTPATNVNTASKTAKENNSAKEDLDKFEDEFSNLDLDSLSDSENSLAKGPVVKDDVSLANEAKTNIKKNDKSPGEMLHHSDAAEELLRKITHGGSVPTSTEKLVKIEPTIETPVVPDSLASELSVEQAEDILQQITHSTKPIKRNKSAEEPIAENNPQQDKITETPVKPANQTEESITVATKVIAESIDTPVSPPNSQPFSEEKKRSAKRDTDDDLLGAQNFNSPGRDTVLPHAKIANEKDDFTLSGPTLHVEKSDTPLKTTTENLKPIAGVATEPPSDNHYLDNKKEIAMKLDLAKQYLDAGDKESAKSVLREIIEVADHEQKLEAELMLSSIL